MCSRIDADGSGEIDYSEWVIAAVDKAAMVTEENLNRIFRMFDKDGGGSISLTELEDIILAGQAIDSRLLQEALNQVDDDGGGEIEFDEFKQMMSNLVSNDVKEVESS